MKRINILSLTKEFEMNNLNSFDQLFIISELLRIENCRCSEILAATWQNYHANRFLILEGKKRSASVIIRDRELLKLISNIPKTNDVLIFPNVTYRQVYQYIKSRYGHQFEIIKGRKNKKITHAYRYINLRAIDNDENIKQILHHNSKKSGMYYKNKLKGV